MRTATRPFLALTAADLMTAPVMTIPHDMSLRQAAGLLSRSSISGAPVVDADGCCLGVLSSSDFVTWAVKAEDGGQKRDDELHRPVGGADQHRRLPR
jgi:predicted transcriptional regulator